jgi:hypothetical protein
MMSIFQRGVENFLDHRREPVNLVDEQHIVFFKIGQQGGQVFGFLKHRAAGLAQIDTQLGGNDVR